MSPRNPTWQESDTDRQAPPLAERDNNFLHDTLVKFLLQYPLTALLNGSLMLETA
jgi:hypothetical protein